MLLPNRYGAEKKDNSGIIGRMPNTVCTIICKRAEGMKSFALVIGFVFIVLPAVWAAPRKTTKAPAEKCGRHQTYYAGCGPCYATCEEPSHDFCNRMCNGPACFCDPPYVMNVKKKKCVLVKKCPKQGLQLK
ncbi:hypothetical protein QR680_015644 [Steinernema hermaphroditum]|uniref:TIL domain-containing protein n=1 Tax=Steinernema hermaphroditum TaxID=289476 RepID=A0AA39LL97_9BILA|nr:hypothetical protein QR680_015644 [Steinernema hermaphroditum]